MPHIILNMDTCLDSMAGNATTGKLVDLKTAYHEVDANLPTTEKPEDAHELLERIQAFLCNGGSYELGAASQTQQFIDDCSAYR